VTPRCRSWVAARPSYRHARADQAGLLGGARAFGGDAAAARRDQRLHAARGDARDDLAPVVAQVRLAADQDDLDHAELGELIDEVERLGGGQLVGARTARARAAVAAREVARERDLPDGEDGTGCRVELAHLVRERQVAPRRWGHRCDRQLLHAVRRTTMLLSATRPTECDP
jgi:hypothetical protein